MDLRFKRSNRRIDKLTNRRINQSKDQRIEESTNLRIDELKNLRIEELKKIAPPDSQLQPAEDIVRMFLHIEDHRRKGSSKKEISEERIINGRKTEEDNSCA